MNELTKEAEIELQNIMASEKGCIYGNGLEQGIRKGMTDPRLLKAQQLYTREEVRKMIIDAFDEGNPNGFILKTGEEYAESVLPNLPKTEADANS